MPGGDVIGREPELGLVSAFLDRSVERPAGFVIEGEPGIGKSTLWFTAVVAARERGLRVVQDTENVKSLKCRSRSRVSVVLPAPEGEQMINSNKSEPGSSIATTSPTVYRELFGLSLRGANDSCRG